MKKLLVLILAFCCASVLHAQNNNGLAQKLQTAVKKRLQASSSSNAHEDGVIMITLKVDAQFQDVEANNKPIDKKCPAVRIAPNTLLASRACIDLSGKGELYEYRGGGAEYAVSTHPVSRWVENIKINDKWIGKENFRGNDKLLVIAIDGTNAALKSAVEKLPITDLFVAKDAQKLQTVFPKMTLNRDDTLWGRECAEVDIVNVCTDTQCFKVCWKFIDGDTGDPVFGRNPERSNLEYLLGFNVTNSNKAQRKSGRWYHFLSQSSLNFLKNALPAQEWNYIKAHTKDETLYK